MSSRELTPEAEAFVEYVASNATGCGNLRSAVIDAVADVASRTYEATWTCDAKLTWLFVTNLSSIQEREYEGVIDEMVTAVARQYLVAA